MSRVQLALNVNDIEEAVAFYGASWEIYTVLADCQTFYDHDHGAPGCCGDHVSQSDASQSGEPAASAAKCC